MKRISMILATLVALTGCKIEDAEYFDPTRNGYLMFLPANACLADAAADAARLIQFNEYYSVSGEERKMLHDRYFYSSRIVDSGNDEWRIIDCNGELVVRTGGRTLGEEGATWRYAYAGRDYAENVWPTIACRKSGLDTFYDLELPGQARLSFTAAFYDRPQENGMTRYWCELRIEGSGLCPEHRDGYGAGEVGCEIVEPLKYLSDRPRSFDAGKLKLTTQTNNKTYEAEAEYGAHEHVSISYGQYKNYYWY
ncbi:MAG: hypothetical protein K2N04_04930 [Alistipes sp.]|nr:hypothetical protein [Alistipes sp.]